MQNFFYNLNDQYPADSGCVEVGGNYIRYGSDERGEFFHAVFIGGIVGNYYHFVTYVRLGHVGQIHDGLIHGDFTHDRNAAALDCHAGAIAEIPQISVTVAYRNDTYQALARADESAAIPAF